MSSTERAPEPTMEEILASIRRIISEDETNSARPHEATAGVQDDEGLEGTEGEADDRIINDIARVLGGSAQMPAQGEEEILDLTAELGGLEIVEEETIILETEAEIIPVEAIAQPEMPAPAMEEPQAVAAPAPEPAPEPQPEPVMRAPATPMSASEEAASALERAIAALRAGQLPTSVPEFAPSPQPGPQFIPEAYAAPISEPEAEAEPEPEAQLVLTEFEAEAVAEEPVPMEEPASIEEPPSVSELGPAWEADQAPWIGAPEPLVEPERASLRTNGHSGEDETPKTLEDSVKDMLRPMLRQWLDENMPRMVSAALKDELRDNPARFQRD
jgi:cell pole-organizing protein PopZ